MTLSTHVDTFERKIIYFGQRLKKKFPHNSSCPTAVEQQIMYKDLQKLGIKLLEELQYSVIEGEYIIAGDFENKLSACRRQTKEILKFVPEITYANVENLFCNVLIDVLDNFRNLVHKYNIRINDPDKIFLISEFGHEDKDKVSLLDVVDLQGFREIFYCNIFLASVDMEFSLAPKYLQHLFLLLKRLQDSQYCEENYCRYLIDKCKLFIYKFRLRYKNDEFFKAMLISFDFEDRELDPDALELVYLSGVKRQVTDAYPAVHREENRDALYNYVRAKKHVPTSRLDYFWFVQYYRKNKESLEDINNLIIRFEQSQNENRCRFDERSYNTCLNYLNNNRVSLLCKKIEDDTKDDFTENLNILNREFEHIRSLQDRTDTKNYYPYRKLACCYSKYLDRFYKRDIGNIGTEIAEEYLKRLLECTKWMSKYLDWGKRSGFLPFLPRFEDCQIRQEQAKIFLYSSCILPVNYQEAYETLKKLEDDYQRHKITLNVHQSLQGDRKRIEIAQKEAKDSQKNNIQILAIFATLVVFVMGSIQLFREFTSPVNAIQFMLALAFSLCLFSLAIWMIVNDHKIWRWVIGIFILISTVISIYVLMRDVPQNSRKSQDVPQVISPYSGDSVDVNQNK